MEKLEFITKSNQLVVDNFLSEEIGNYSDKNTPFTYAVNEKINKYLLEEKVVDSTFLTSEKEIKLPPYRIEHSVNHYKDYTKNLQSWIGYVTEVNEKTFKAELIDMTNGGTKEVADFEVLDVSPQDRHLISNGATFYWNIGQKMRSGQATNESIIRFQRVVLFNEDDINEAADSAADLFENLKFE